MDKNHQDETESRLAATQDKLTLPPLSAEEQGQPARLHKEQNKPKTRIIDRAGFSGKTLWDWLPLLLQLLGALAIPVAIALGTAWFSYQQNQTSLQISERQHDADQQRALDQQEATTLQTYIDNIQDLLLNHDLLKSRPDGDVAILARARTLVALQGLDGVRKGRLLTFLYEAKLIGFLDFNFNTHSPIINLREADLSGAYLYDAILSGANLWGANLNDSDLRWVDLQGADLGFAHLRGANLSRAKLNGTHFNFADLSGVHLNATYLNFTNLSFANLNNADLNGANLKSALYLTQQQLDQVKTCKNAILPSGLTCHHN